MLSNRKIIASLGATGVAVAMLAAVVPQRAEDNTMQAKPRTSDPQPERVIITQKGKAFNGGTKLLNEYCGRNWDKSCLENIEILIATVPDPFDSQLDWAYDAELEAMHRAIEASGYLIDRFVLSGRADSVRMVTNKDTTMGLRREVHPGVMLFRFADQSVRKALLLYVVGELPTSGIYKEALQAALSERIRIRQKMGWTPASDVTRIVGPVFSGSVNSLVFALQNAKACRTRETLIISGSATSPLIAKAFAHLPCVSYRSAVNSDAYLQRLLRDEVIKHFLRADSGAVAVLRESSTAYGQSDSLGTGFINITFPLNIANLRSEYDRNPAAKKDPFAVTLTPTSSRIPLSLEDPARRRVTPAVLSLMTPPAMDLTMHEIIETLRRKEVKAVVLLATDVRDKVFLADIIKQELKDVQLITFESNNLLLSQDYRSSLAGMLVLSTFPLFLDDNGKREFVAFSAESGQGVYNAVRSQMADIALRDPYHKASADPQFSSSTSSPGMWVSAIGANSIVPVLHKDYSPGEQRMNVSSLETSGLSFVWAAGLMFVIVVGLLIPARYIHRVLRTPWAPSAWGPIPWGFWTLKLRRMAMVFRRRNPRTNYGNVQDASLAIHSDLYAGLRNIGVFGLGAPLLLILFRHSASWAKVPFAIGGLLFLVVVIAGIVLSVTRVAIALWCCRVGGLRYASHRDCLPGLIHPKHRGWKRTTPGWLWLLEIVSRLATAAFGLAFFVFILLLLAEITRMGGKENIEFQLFSHRALNLDTGLSPLLPIILASLGLTVWSSWHTQRVRHLRIGTAFEAAILGATKERRARPRRTWNIAGGFARVRAEMHHVRERLFLLVPQPICVVLYFALVVVFIWTGVQMLQTRSFEAVARQGSFTAFDWIFKGSILAALIGTSWAVCRFVSVWIALRKTLTGIADTPLPFSYATLPLPPDRIARPTLIGSGSVDAVGYIANEQWAQLAAVAARVRPADASPAVIQQIHAIPGLNDRFWWRRKPTRRMGRQLASVHRVLTTIWKDQPRSRWTPDDQNGVQTKSYFNFAHSRNLSDWRLCAEEFVALQSVYYIEWVQQHLRRLALFLLVGLLLTMGLLSSYPFHPQSVVQVIFAILVIVTIFAMLYVMTQMQRDPILSVLSGSKPGALEWNTEFVLNLVLFGAIPTLALLSSEFPEVRDIVFAWVQPLLQTLGK